MALGVGSRVNEKYEILKVIDTGGMSTVYIAMDINLNKNWAIKEIIKKPSKMGTVEYKSLITETNLLKDLDHVFLPRIVDIIEDSQRIFVVMDYIEGKTLEDVISTEGGLPQDKVVKWAKQLTQVLGYLHSRNPAIIYRDMKPSNIMLQPNGNIKLIDFGTSRTFENENSLKTAPLGTKGYAAPERYGSTASDRFSVRSDIYELGMTFYHMLTGHNPSKSPEKIKSILEWNPNINKGLVKVVEKMTKADPDLRYQSTSELLYDLQNYHELDSEYQLKLSKRLKTILMTGVASVALFLVGGTTLYANSAINQNTFEQKLLEAETNYDSSLAIEATHIKRDSVQPYLVMMNIFKGDGKFTNVEEVELLSTINSNKSEIVNTEDYGKLANHLARLYFYRGFEIEDMTNKQLEWLEIAISKLKDNDSALALKNYIINANNIKTGKAKVGVYKDQWTSITSLAFVSYEDSYEDLMNVKLMFDFVNSNVGKLKEAGVSKDDVLSNLESANNKLQNFNLRLDNEIKLSDTLKSQYESIISKVNSSFK